MGSLSEVNGVPQEEVALVSCVGDRFLRDTPDCPHETPTRTAGWNVAQVMCWLSAREAGGNSKQLILAAEHLTHRAIGEDLADRAGEEIGAGEDPDEVGGAWGQRDRVGDDDLLEVGGGQVRPGVS